MQKKTLHSFIYLKLAIIIYIVAAPEAIAAPSTMDYINAMTACGFGARSTVTNETKGVIRRQIDGDIASGRAADEIIPKIADTALAEASRNHNYELYDRYVACLKDFLKDKISDINDIKSSVSDLVVKSEWQITEQSKTINDIGKVAAHIDQIQQQKLDDIAVKALNGDTLAHKVLMLLSAGQVDDAIRLLQQQADADLAAGDARTQLGIAEYDQISALLINRDPQRAQAAASKVLQINPRDPDAMLLILLLSALNGNLQYAMKAAPGLEQLFSGVSYEGQILQYLGSLSTLFQSGDIDNAVISLKKDVIELRNRKNTSSSFSIADYLILALKEGALCTMGDSSSDRKQLLSTCKKAISDCTDIEKQIGILGFFTPNIAGARLQLGKLASESGDVNEAMAEISQAENLLITAIGEQPKTQLLSARLLDVYTLSLRIQRQRHATDPGQLAALADRARREIAHVRGFGKLGTVIGASVATLEHELGLYNEGLEKFDAARAFYLETVETWDSAVDLRSPIGELGHAELLFDASRMAVRLGQIDPAGRELRTILTILAHPERTARMDITLVDLLKALSLYIDVVNVEQKVDESVDLEDLEGAVSTAASRISCDSGTLGLLSQFYDKYETYEHKKGKLREAKMAGHHWLELLLQARQSFAGDSNDTAIAKQYAWLGDMSLDPLSYNETQALEAYLLAAIISRNIWFKHPNLSSGQALDVLFAVDQQTAEITLVRRHRLELAGKARMKSDFLLVGSYARVAGSAGVLSVERLEEDWFLKLMQYNQYSDAKYVANVGLADADGVINKIGGRGFRAQAASIWNALLAVYFDATNKNVESEIRLRKAIRLAKESNGAVSPGSLTWDDHLHLLYRLAVHVAMNRDCTVLDCRPELRGAWEEEIIKSRVSGGEHDDVSVNEMHGNYWSAMFFRKDTPISWIYYYGTTPRENQSFKSWEGLELSKGRLTTDLLRRFLIAEN